MYPSTHLRAPLVLGMAAAVLTACGARSGLSLDRPDGVDAVDASTLDAGTRLDGGADAPAGLDTPPGFCPPLSDFGYRLERLSDGPAFAVQTLAMAGDGERVFLAVGLEGVDASRVFELDGRGEIVASLEVPDLVGPELTFVDDRLFVLGRSASDELLVLLSGRELSALTRQTTAVVRGPIRGWAAPGWNGEDVVIATDNGFELFVGPFVPDGVMPAWRSFGPAFEVRLTIDPRTGESHALHRGGDRQLRIESFARDGTPLGIAGTVLEEVGLMEPEIGWSEDGDAPWVLAGATMEAGEGRTTLRRFRRDGSAAGGFSAPWPGGSTAGDVALSTAPPVGHRAGYGMVFGHVGSGGATFHGAGRDFVGDARSLPSDCDGAQVAIASGPCGYVVACTALDGGVALALAVPPPPR